MVKLDLFQGDHNELATFVSDVWRRSYSGKMTFPVWSAEYFRWHFPENDPQARERMIAAYDGDRLAGVLLGIPLRFRTPDKSLPGAMCSWLSIDQDYRGHRLAVELDRVRQERLRSLGTDLVVSYRFVGSRHSQAERPDHPHGSNKQFLRRVGFWSRVIDPVRMWKWDRKQAEGLMALGSYPVAGIPRSNCEKHGIRVGQLQDLPGCLSLLQRHTESMSLAIDWDESTLKRQLFGSPISHTLVCERGGEIRGVINFHLLEFQGRTCEPIGIIDVASLQELPHSSRVALMNEAMRVMRQHGAILALKLRTQDVPITTMLHTRWTPTQADSFLVLQWLQNQTPVQPDYPMHLLWR